MGSWDGAEACELVGLFLLSQLSHIKSIQAGLYRDDGLAACELRPRQTELVKKNICSIFQQNGLKITIEANLKSVDFLDVNLNLELEIYKPYMKPNDKPIYVDRNSNHPPSILKNIPESINNRLSKISANEEVFNQAIPPFQEALQKSGYDFQLKFSPPAPNQQKKNCRKRKITWFNPPFSKHVKTNIGKKFLELLDKHFPAGHPLSKIVNRNCVKISYKCMPNMKSVIAKHNCKVKKQNEEQIQPGCNCSGRLGPSPLDGKCLVTNVVYKDKVVDNDATIQTYTGLTSTTFKKRFYKHRTTFEKPNHDPTTLSNHVWDLKNNHKTFNISWSVIDKAPDFNPATGKCRLCLKEKFYIIFQPEGATLNQRSELFTACRHKKFKTLEKT